MTRPIVSVIQQSMQALYNLLYLDMPLAVSFQIAVVHHVKAPQGVDISVQLRENGIQTALSSL